MKIILTGTRAYGPVGPDSDWDIVIGYWDADQLKSILGKEGIEIHKNSDINLIYQGFWFILFDAKIQIICANNDEDLIAWEKATNKMIDLPVFPDRKLRVTQFQRFYNAAKERR